MTKLQVRTAHSDYLIDTTKKTFVRTPRHEHANPLPSHSGAELSYDGTVEIEVGQPLLIGRGLSWLRSTPVESITEVDA